tara:strand:- start:30 stop:284 length:255 start_codon:yes stop_codon:yes gene_type:complete
MSTEMYDIVGLVRDISIVVSLTMITTTISIVGIKIYKVTNGLGRIVKQAENVFSELQNIQEGGRIVKLAGRSVMVLGKLFKKLG